MTISILRTADAWWVQTTSGAARVATDATTTAELLADRAAIDAAAHSTDTVPVDSLALLSPITTPCRVVAQATNFASHVKDVGRDPAKSPLTFFRKASGSVAGPFDDIVKPAHVKLLDYELEIGLVIGRELPVGTEVTDANLADFVVGLVVTNDISARDVQLHQGAVLRVEVLSHLHPGRAGAGAARPPRNSSVSVTCGCGCRSTARCARTWSSRATSSTRRCRHCRRCRSFSTSMPATSC